MRVVRIRYSKDGGSNWSDWRIRSLGEIGEFCKSVEVSRMGQARQFVFEVSNTSPVSADLIAASIQVEGVR